MFIHLVQIQEPNAFPNYKPRMNGWAFAAHDICQDVFILKLKVQTCYVVSLNFPCFKFSFRYCKMTPNFHFDEFLLFGWIFVSKGIGCWWNFIKTKNEIQQNLFPLLLHSTVHPIMRVSRLSQLQTELATYLCIYATAHPRSIIRVSQRSFRIHNLAN